jgi:predicted alpha/beta hydrolase family esterase
VLVGHSLGGYVLAKHLAKTEDGIGVELCAIALIAAPFPSADPNWVFEGFELPPDLARRLPDTAVFLYASEDDEIVPFAHRARYAEAIPHAVVRTTVGGHQLGNDLTLVAEDIRRVVESAHPA